MFKRFVSFTRPQEELSEERNRYCLTLSCDEGEGVFIYFLFFVLQIFQYATIRSCYYHKVTTTFVNLALSPEFKQENLLLFIIVIII